MNLLQRILIIVFALPIYGQAEAFNCRKPKEEDKQKSTFCFFSLNNLKEKTTFATKYENLPNVEVIEFYGEEKKGQSVKERFKDMLKKGECDSLVISGHHTGYFAGEQSTAHKGDDWKLDLDFIEELSCEEDCEDWFSNVKSLFLMGCQTVEPKKVTDPKYSADSETIRITAGAPESHMRKTKMHRQLNQAYSSTLDENKKLSHRYLRMFPESSLYGWGDTSPGVKAGSQNSLPNFIHLVTNLQKAPHNPHNVYPAIDYSQINSQEQDILNFITFMNSDSTCHKYSEVAEVAEKWALHWSDKGAKATSCFLDPKSDMKQRFKRYQQQGCALTKALKGGNKEEINQALDSILDSSESVKANFNRLMSLVTNKENHGKGWYKEVKQKLKGSNNLKLALVQGIDSSNTGFVRKSDYLYFYNSIGWGGEDKTRDKQLSQTFLTQLNRAFDNIGEEQPIKKDDGEIKKGILPNSVQTAHRKVVFESMKSNGLVKWLSQNTPQEFDKLQNKFIGSPDFHNQWRGHLLTYLQEDPQTAETDEFFKKNIERAKKDDEIDAGLACWIRDKYTDESCPF